MGHSPVWDAEATSESSMSERAGPQGLRNGRHFLILVHLLGERDLAVFVSGNLEAEMRRR